MMNEVNKLRMGMITELIVMIIMLLNFVYEPNKVFQFFSLFLALMSAGFMFDHRREFMELEK